MYNKRFKPNRYSGFTQIEVMVAIGIIALLVAVLLPAILHVRERARAVQCTNNLKQLALALHNYHDKHLTFPAGVLNEWSWTSKILPEIEQGNLFKKIDFYKEPFDLPNAEYVQEVLPVLVCPSDFITESTFYSVGCVQFSHTNYFGTNDHGYKSGMLGFNEVNRLREVRDGIATTLFLGERVKDATGETGWWAWDPVLSFEEGFHDEGLNDTNVVDRFWSHHPGGAHFAMVDGSVHFIAYEIEEEVFYNLGTKDGLEYVEKF